MAAAKIESEARAGGKADRADLKQTLLARRAQLTQEIEDGQQRRQSEDSFGALAGEVADAGDASLAAEESDLRTTQIERDVAELRDIDAALDRIRVGTYGVCTRCGADIGEARLHANPSASRCIECQTALEHQFAGNATPSL